MIKALILFSLSSSVALASSGTDLLLKNSKLAASSEKIVENRKMLNLDDTFLVQSYGTFRALGIKDPKIQNFFDLVFEKSNLKALKVLDTLNTKNKSQKNLLSATRLYLLWKLDIHQTFFNAWLEESHKYNFLDSELGVALDQIIGIKASNWLIKNAVFISNDQISKIDAISSKESLYNYSVQALRNLRRGEKSLPWIRNLKATDPLRVKLAESVILHYARNSKLAESAKILKEIFEPVLLKETNTEKISAYYMLVGRLLYQAGAYDASKAYYKMIPDESKKFLQSRVEALWISMRENDHSVIFGELKTLEMDVFKEEFLPELYLVSSMANLQLCQFSPVEKAFKDFISNNKKFAKEIDKNLNSSDPSIIDKDNFYINQLTLAFNLRKIEIKKIKKIFKDSPLKVVRLNEQKSQIKKIRSAEIKRSWQNRQTILESTLRRMRFVKVEFLSKMRRLQGQMNKLSRNDSVSTLTSALDKKNKLEFKYDGTVFGDELFHYTSKIKNLCLQGSK